jgi:hypothetical protein
VDNEEALVTPATLPPEPYWGCTVALVRFASDFLDFYAGLVIEHADDHQRDHSEHPHPSRVGDGSMSGALEVI